MVFLGIYQREKGINVGMLLTKDYKQWENTEVNNWRYIERG